MKKTILGICLAVVLSACATTSSGPPVVSETDLGSLPQELQAIAGYSVGDSRAGVLAVEALVKEATASGGGSALAADLAAFLHAGVSADAKQVACRQLALIGSEAEVPAIAALLYDASTADMARYALQPIPSDAVDDALLTALDSAPAETHVGIISSLGARGSASAVPTLQKIAGGINPATAEAAQAALARIEG